MSKKDLIIGKTHESKKVEEVREKAVRKAIEEKARVFLTDKFIKNPQLIPIRMTNRRFLVPMILVDPYMRLGEGVAPIEKSNEMIMEELNKKAEIPLPVVSFDPSLVEYGFKKGQVNYVIISSFGNITKKINYKGLGFWVFDLHEIVAFIEKEDISLLTSNLSDDGIEEYREISDESKIQ